MTEKEKYLFGPDARVLMLLLEHDRINRSAFQSVYRMNIDAAKNSLNYFRSLGLTDFEEIGDRRDTMVWFLTDKGKIAAKLLAELIDLIENENQ